MNTKPIISIELSIVQVNTVLMALSEAPYRVSAPLIATIMEQAEAGQKSSTDIPAPTAALQSAKRPR
jgi:hypothetical protein